MGGVLLSVEAEINGTALIIRFTRPEVRNPLSSDVLDGIESTIKDAPEFRKVIFTGAHGVFASGANLNEIAALNAEKAPGFATRGQRLMDKIARLDAMTTAAVNGYCFGGALDLALACDRRIASPNAKFAHPGAGLGIITGWGGTQRLPRLIGTANALEMFFTAAPINADRAHSLGLVDQISDDPLLAALDLIAEAI